MTIFSKTSHLLAFSSYYQSLYFSFSKKVSVNILARGIFVYNSPIKLFLLQIIWFQRIWGKESDAPSCTVFRRTVCDLQISTLTLRWMCRVCLNIIFHFIKLPINTRIPVFQTLPIELMSIDFHPFHFHTFDVLKICSLEGMSYQR